MEFVAIMTAATALLGAIVAVLVQVRTLTKHTNSRLDELIQVTRAKAYAEGGADERERATGETQPGAAPASTPRV